MSLAIENPYFGIRNRERFFPNWCLSINEYSILNKKEGLHKQTLL